MKLVSILAASLLAVAPYSPAAAAPERAPRLRAGTLNDLAPLPLPYDEKANARRAVAQAQARARAQNKLLLVDFGGNWCADCRILAGVMKQPEMRPFLNRHYVIVEVDVGRFDKNMDIPKRYGVGKLEGVPAVLIVDPSTGKVINRNKIFAVADARSMTPQGLADWLAGWTR